MDNKSIEQAFGLHGVPSGIDDVIQRLCFFAPTGSGAYLRDLHEFLVLHSMSMLSHQEVSARSIYTNITSAIGIQFEFESIIDALVRLESKNDVYCTSPRVQDIDARFRLAPGKQNQLRELLEVEKKNERDAINEWVHSIQRMYPSLKNSEIDQLVQDLKVFAFRLLSQQSIETLQVFYGDSQALLALLDKLDKQDLSDIWQTRSDDYGRIRLQEVTRFFRDATDTGKQYIASLMNSIFILQLTRLDPECAAIVRSQLAQSTVFLDTNFVFRLVGLQGPDLFLASKKLVNISQQLGFRLVISPQTLSEYNHTLGEFLREMRGRPVVTSELAAAALTATNDEDFITAYWSYVKEKGTYVDPSTFYEYFKYLEQILTDFKVELDDTFDSEIQSKEAELAFEEGLLLESVQYRNKHANISPYVLRHDAHHRLLILRYREGIQRETFNNTRAWFLTCDSKLPPYDRLARKRKRNNMQLPFCVTSGQWMQTLRPLSGSNGDLNIAQVNLLVSPLLRAYQRPPSQLINNIVSRLAMSSRYSINAVTAMLSDQQFLEQYDAASDTVAQQDIIDNFYASYADEMETSAKAALDALEAEKTEREKQTQLYEEETRRRTRLEEKIARQDQLNTKTLAQLEATKNEFRIAQSDAEKERKEREKLEKDKLAREIEFSERLQQLSTQLSESNLKIRRHTAIGIFVSLFIVLYFIIRQPWQITPPAILEMVGVLALGMYVIASIIFRMWESKIGVLITVIAPAILMISFFIPSELASSIQIAAIMVPAIHFIWTLAWKGK